MLRFSNRNEARVTARTRGLHGEDQHTDGQNARD